jgi:hypothetical protein
MAPPVFIPHAAVSVTSKSVLLLFFKKEVLS